MAVLWIGGKINQTSRWHAMAPMAENRYAAFCGVHVYQLKEVEMGDR